MLLFQSQSGGQDIIPLQQQNNKIFFKNIIIYSMQSAMNQLLFLKKKDVMHLNVFSAP